MFVFSLQNRFQMDIFRICNSDSVGAFLPLFPAKGQKEKRIKFVETAGRHHTWKPCVTDNGLSFIRHKAAETLKYSWEINSRIRNFLWCVICCTIVSFVIQHNVNLFLSFLPQSFSQAFSSMTTTLRPKFVHERQKHFGTHKSTRCSPFRTWNHSGRCVLNYKCSPIQGKKSICKTEGTSKNLWKIISTP